MAYLKRPGDAYYSAHEIAKRAAGRIMYKDSPDWVRVVMTSLVDQGLVEQNDSGHFRIKRVAIEANGRKWVSPHIAKLLNKEGKAFDKIVVSEIEEDE